MALMQAAGIAIDLPAGWDAEIYRRLASVSTLSSSGASERTNTVLHAANFALPEPRGDFGSGAIEVMESADLMIVIFEYNSEDRETALFSTSGIPIPLVPDDFHPHNMQRARKGFVGCQRFFNSGGRAWSLYVMASEVGLSSLVSQANAVLATVDLTEI